MGGSALTLMKCLVHANRRSPIRLVASTSISFMSVFATAISRSVCSCLFSNRSPRRTRKPSSCMPAIVTRSLEITAFVQLSKVLVSNATSPGSFHSTINLPTTREIDLLSEAGRCPTGSAEFVSSAHPVGLPRDCCWNIYGSARGRRGQRTERGGAGLLRVVGPSQATTPQNLHSTDEARFDVFWSCTTEGI